MSEKIVIELTPEQYSMLMHILRTVAPLKGTSSSFYARRLLAAIKESSRVEKERDADV